MKTIFSILFIIVTLVVSGQQKANLYGTVMDEKRKAMEDVNVMLLKAKDSSLVKGVITGPGGSYQFKLLNQGLYILLFSKTGYRNLYLQLQTISDTGKNVEVEPVVLLQEVRSLKEVVITGKRPFIEQKLDRMIINIENSIINAGDDGLEVLQKLPGVSIQPNGELSLKGRGGVKVFIDGRPTNMSADDLASFLRGMMASQIERIEIISNPSSRYDAAGSGGIINVRMKRDQKIGLNGTITLGYSQGVYAKYNGGLNMNFRNKYLNAFGSYSVNDRQSFTNMTGYKKFNNGNNLLANFIQAGKAIERTRSYNMRTGLDLFISSRSTLGFLVTGLNSHFSQATNNQTIIKGNTGVTDSMLFNYTNNPSKWSSYAFNINFKHKFDSAGTELNIDGDYSSYDRDSRQFLKNTPANASGNSTRTADTLSGTLPAELNIASFKADFVHPLKAGSKIEAGIKSSRISNDNDILFYNQYGQGPKLNNALSNHFIYKENINAFYGTYSREVKKWNYQVGLRGEQTIAKGNQVTTSEKFTRNYFQLFPTAFINFTPSAKHQVGLSYARRVGRPAYNIVNPFKIFRDPYTYSEGNPLIRPELSNNIELNYIFNNIIIAGLSYGSTRNSMTFVVRQDDATKTTVETYDNLAKLQDGGVSVSANFKIAPWWSCNNFFGVFYNHFVGVFNNQAVNNSGAIYNVSINHSITLPRNYTIDLNGFYLSKQPQGIITISPQANVNIGLQKQFLQKRASIRLTFSDLFHTQQWEKITRFANINAGFKSTWDSRQVRLNISWKFGKQTVQAERKRKTSSEDEKSRVQIDQGR